MARMSRDDLLDALFDLQHDLGKYLCLPLAWLPADATPEEVRQAALKALLETRSGPTGNRSSNDLWQAFVEEVGGELKDTHKWPALTTAVIQALAWSETLQKADAPPNRHTITTDFTRVAHAIRDLIKELTDAS
mgnify:CR=1 FL=1|jgi:hypothetical protein